MVTTETFGLETRNMLPLWWTQTSCRKGAAHLCTQQRLLEDESVKIVNKFPHG